MASGGAPDSGDQDATMSDIGEKAPPPGDPPDTGGRRAPAPENRMVFTAKKQGTNLERNLKDISGNNNIQNIQPVKVTNRFGSLEDNSVSRESREVVNSGGANKENEIMINPQGREKSADQVKGKAVGSFEKGKGGNNDGAKDRRQWAQKVVDINGPKTKYHKQTRPTRGLIFGPTKGGKDLSEPAHMELSESGKRLRMEQGSVGRPGGVFVKNNEGNVGGESSSTNGPVEMGGVQSSPEEEMRNGEIVLHSGSLGGGAVLPTA
ncbi:unnamed protein product [Arabidopsis arenosa]|uniref:Uncharacterized protein n=1 Tax=Arabidopsis arenosa TaxID=38785 RepID=A0A8S1ZX41_ARAAE|nr:unnamed protein product [Arabidopsis arenosa]